MQLGQQIVAVMAVLGLLLLVLTLLRRKGFARFPIGRGGAAPRRLELLERAPLTAQHSVHLIRLADRLLLVGVSPSGCQLLESFQDRPAQNGGEAS
jgi:flagellar biogenesis protein FliO